jgi:hypothetical protein
MVDEKINKSEVVLEDFIETPYKYGFKTDIETESFPKGLNIDIIKKKTKKTIPKLLFDPILILSLFKVKLMIFEFSYLLFLYLQP